nr:polymorphic toxin-type HINT domain-containing protein [Paenibacillus dendritiformis]
MEIQDATGKVLNRYTYDIWGNPLIQEEQVPNIFRCSGEYWDAATELQYLRARWYDPSIGRFLTEDTYEGEINNPLSLNLYTYVYNNPLIYSDPTGNFVYPISPAATCAADMANCKTYLEAQAEAGKTIAVEGAKLLLLDDINTLISSEASFGEKALAAASLTPFGKAFKIIKAESKIGKLLLKCNCFTAGTKVLTDKGEKPIEEIEVGEKVLAKDENNPDGELAYKEVTNLYRNQRDDIIKLYVGEQVIETTDNHPFWVEGKGWVFADEVQVGDKLQKADGSNLTIDKVEFVKLDEPVTVYNFTVADYHTYYVTDIGIWVHNTSCVNVTSNITDKRLVKAAEKMGENKRVQSEADALVARLQQGNTNPGKGNNSLGFGGIHELRGDNGARVYFRNTSNGVEVVAKSSKANQNEVIRVLRDLYGK